MNFAYYFCNRLFNQCLIIPPLLLFYSVMFALLIDLSLASCYGVFSAVCELPCANGGRCVGPNTCQCPSDYNGPQCLLREFNSLTETQLLAAYQDQDFFSPRLFQSQALAPLVVA